VLVLDENISEYLTIFEVSEKTRFKVPTLRKYVLRRTIPFHKINRAIRFKADEINAWLASGEKKTVAAPDSGGRAGEAKAQGDLPFGEKT
jgi:excisionase family DNA binding protein